MNVCDRCKKSGKLNKLIIKNRKAELCDTCADRVITWLDKPETPSGLASLFGGGR